MLKKISKKDLQEILKLHYKWLQSEKDGVRANLYSADLRSANLYGANLRSADLRSANLRSADLRSADLYGANLRSADLYGANLRSADLRSANLYGANLRSADLRSADLYSADLRSANLYGADLYSADLRSANLYSADLYGADLRSADLYGANLLKAINIIPDLHILKHQPGKLVAYKYFNRDGTSPVQNTKYDLKKGAVYTCDDGNPDERQECAAGLNVATLPWCVWQKQASDVIAEVEFTAKDIIAIPITTDGKFRVSQFKIVRILTKKQIDEMMTLNLGEKEKIK